jgi:hypothetical protein
MPRAAEMDVELWPVLNESWTLSSLFGNPEMPFSFLIVGNYLVIRGIKDIMKSQRKFDDSEVRGEVAAVYGHRPDDGLPQFSRQGKELFGLQPLDVSRRIDRIEEH